MRTATASARERPIIFSGESVRAILAGTKTQTRRVVKPQPQRMTGLTAGYNAGDHRWAWFDKDGSIVGRRFACRYGRPGDQLWVKHPARVTGRSANGFTVSDGGFGTPSRSFRWEDAGNYMVPDEGRGFGLAFPRRLSMLTLVLRAVRVERVQAITHADALAEGCTGSIWVASSPYIAGPHTDDGELPVEEYVRTWDALNAARGFPWSANPWVYALTFSVVETQKVLHASQG